MKKITPLFTLLAAFAVLAFWSPVASAQHNPGGPTYKDFAQANGWYTPAAGDTPEAWVDDRKPGDDPDEDGLKNEDEWAGWTVLLNGVQVWYSWNTEHDPDRLPGSSLTKLDTDCDGISDNWEEHLKTDPQSADSDGDGLWDAWEAYVGLNPSDNGEGDPNQSPDMDVDGDGLSALDEYSAWLCGSWSWACALGNELDIGANKGFPYATILGKPNWTSPTHFDTDNDGLIDSYEVQYGNLTRLNPRVWDDAAADFDRDGLYNFREMCVHPLLAQFQSGTDIPGTARFPVSQFGSMTIGHPTSGQGLMTSGYLNLAFYTQGTVPLPVDSQTSPGVVNWGHPIKRVPPGWCGGAGTVRWTSPIGADSDGDGLPDGWELEHGLNPLSGSGTQVQDSMFLDVSGALGDPDADTLLNLQEYWGADQYRINLITGTGDESNPWISRIFNHPVRSEFATMVGQATVGATSVRAPAGYGAPFTQFLPEEGWFGFFDPRLTTVEPRVNPDTGDEEDMDIYYPVVGVPPFVALNDVDKGDFGYTAGYFQHFATAMSGLYYFDADGDGAYTPAVPESSAGADDGIPGDPVWLATKVPGVYTAPTDPDDPTTGDYILQDDPENPLEDGTEATGPLTDAISLVWPMPGYDTDNDGLFDAMEIQMDVLAGVEPSSPVQSHGPYVQRSALITSDAGFSPFQFAVSDGRRFFSADFTVETWVYLTPEVGNNEFKGSLIIGEGAIATLQRKGFDLGLTTVNGFESVPYISYQTLGSGNNTRTVAAARSLPYGQWIHLAGVFNHKDNRLSLYINGLLEQAVVMNEGSASSFLANSTAAGDRKVTFARAADGGCGFAGRLRMDEIRIWGEPRSSTQISDNKSQLVDPVQACSGDVYTTVVPNSLLAYYTFDDGSTMAVDSVRRAKSSLLGYAYPHTAGVLGFPSQEYLYPDTAFGIASDDILGDGSTFVFDANNPSPVRGMLDASRGAFDSDGDGLPDAWEIENELNPFAWNTPQHGQVGTTLGLGGFYDTAWGATEFVIVEWTSELSFRASADLGTTWKSTTAPRIALNATTYGPDPTHVIISDIVTEIISSNQYQVVTETTTNAQLRVMNISGYMAIGETWYVAWDGSPISRISNAGTPELANTSDGDRDLDGDGLSNRYEYWARLNPRYPMTFGTGRLDVDEDFDMDGLSNFMESHLGSRPDLGDTDDDGWLDSIEQSENNSPVSSTSPSKNLALRLDGSPGAYLDIADRSGLRLENWTVEAKVLPTDLNSLALGQGATIVRRVVQDTRDGKLAANFELRVVKVAHSNQFYFVPEARYISVALAGTGVVVKVTGNPASPGHRLPVAAFANDPYPTEGFTHLAATFDTTTAELRIYKNGALMTSGKFPALSRPPRSGQGSRSFVRAGERFAGFLDDIRIWSVVRSESQIYNNMSAVDEASTGLVVLHTMNDGGWPAQQVKGRVINVSSVPPVIEANVGDRYLVASGAGEWAGRDNFTAEWTGSFWTYSAPVIGFQLLDAGSGDVLQWDGMVWNVVTPVSILTSVDFGTVPTNTLRMDSTRWLNAGGDVVTMDTGRLFTNSVLGNVFVDDSSAGDEGDFAWWISQNKFYRFVDGAWMAWGPSRYWLDPVRFRLPDFAHVVADVDEMFDMATYTGERFILTDPAQAGAYIYNGWDGFAWDRLLPEDRFLVGTELQIWDGSDLVTVADETMFPGENLYILVRNEGLAYRRDGNGVWGKWGEIPSVEDYTTTEDWNRQWSSAAQIYGNAQLCLLDGVSVSLRDTDGDGLPDDWEIARGLDPNDPTGINGAKGDPDGDGLSNMNEYLLGYDPLSDDTNGNGMNDGEEDYDRDGLPNAYEQDISKTRLDVVDTDDDGLTDYEEAIGKGSTKQISNPINSLDPPVRRSMEFRGNSRLTVEGQARHHLQSWSVMTWVKPASDLTGESILIRRAVPSISPNYTGPNLINYELGLREVQPGFFAPYVRHAGTKGGGDGSAGDASVPVMDIVELNAGSTNDVTGGHQATGLIAAGEWAHLAGTYDAKNHTMSLYINGDLAVYNHEVFAPGGMALGTLKQVTTGFLTIGGGGLAQGIVEAPFKGLLDDVVIMGGALSGKQVQKESSKQISTTLQTINLGVDPVVTQLPIVEALQFEHTNRFVMVRFKASAPATAPAAVSASLGLTVQHSFKIAPIHRLELRAGDSIATKLAALRDDPNVLYAEPDYILRSDVVPNDPLFQGQWGMRNETKQGADISAVDAWSQSIGSEEVIVAVIDTGVDYTHPDLAENMWINKREIPDNGIDDDGNGYVDDVHGWNFSTFDLVMGISAPNDPMDRNGHGTHVAGVIGAVGNNNLGIAGVNWKVKIMPISYLGYYGMGFTSDAILALEYAWQNGARISNNSWGGGSRSQALFDAIQTAGLNGHLFVASAGNAGTDNDLLARYPASYDLPNIIAVAATDKSDLLAEFSCYGVKSVDLAAPGANILSTLPGGTYGNASGTSMAAPFVTGAAALLLSRDMTRNALQLKQSILLGVDTLDSLEGKVLTGGRLNLDKVISSGQVLYLPFNDGGATVEDFTVEQDWNSKLKGKTKDWFHAASRFNAVFSTDSYVPLFVDSDEDGMPDWWEEAMGLDAFQGTGINGADGDPDGDGLSNFYEYLAGTHPFQSDSNKDGISDFNADSDGDGLSNGQEQQLGTLPGSIWLGDRVDATDTDDDGITDRDEVRDGTNPLKASSPDLARAMRFAGTGRLVVATEQAHDASLPWTIEAWVKPVGVTTDGIVLRRAEKMPSAQPWVDYELGFAGMTPYISYAFRKENGTYETVRVNALKAIPANSWTHLAAVRDPATLELRLYVNGKCVAYDSSARLPANALRGVFETSMGDRFVGELDAIRVWNYVRSGDEIEASRGILLPEANIEGLPDQNRAPKRIFNFDDGGAFAENSFYLNDWMANWQNVANLIGDAAFVASPWPPIELDSDDDSFTDVDERSNNTLVLRAESPYLQRALKFNGMGSVLADERIDGVETMTYDVSNWTVEAWVKPTAAPVHGRVSVIRRATRDGNLSTFEMGLNPDLTAYIGFNREDDGHSFFEVNTGAKPIRSGEWTHLAAVYSATSNSLVLYVNGMEQVRGTDTSARSPAHRAGRLLLGSAGNGDNVDGYVGELKEVRVWNRVRTPQDILANFSKTLLFSVALLENSFRTDGDGVVTRYMGRVTQAIEDGYWYDHTSIGTISDEFVTLAYIKGRMTHKFTLETWIRMKPAATGGRAVTRKIDVMLKDNEADWRITEAIVIDENGAPGVEWWGQVNIAKPIYEEDEIPNPDPAKSNMVKRKTLNRLEYTTDQVHRRTMTELDVRDGQWHHLAAVGDSERIRLYVDGKLETESLSYYVFKARPAPDFETFYWQYHNAGSVLRIGDDTLQADLDEVMIWNEDRTQSEVQSHMKYGMTDNEIKAARRVISPVPAKAMDDDLPHVDLVSYMFFDGTPELPSIVDAANEGVNFRILPSETGNEILRNSRPPIFVDRLRAFKDDLRGYFPADDGGETAENFMKRNNLSYAGLLQGDARFVTANATLEDSDGDGLPDWWEELHDLDAGDPNGLNGAYGDADGDGLTNIAEYLAGTDPNNWDTNGDGKSDFNSSAGGLTFGELFMDGDQIPDTWEVLYPDVLSPLRNDAHLDPDGDGWDNLSEYLATGYEYVSSVVNTNEGGDTNGTTRTFTKVISTKPNDAQSFPTPTINFVFTGNCTPAPADKLVVMAFSDLLMRRPDAKHTFEARFVNGLSEAVELWNGGLAAGEGDGHVRQGKNIFMAFIDADANGRYSKGEWMGFSENEIENIQFGSATVRIALTDKPAGYIRFSWEDKMDLITANLQHVQGTTYKILINAYGEGKDIYTTTRNLESVTRPYITEMDMKVAGIAPMSGQYRWYISVPNAPANTYIATGTNLIEYAVTLATPTIVAPKDTTLVHAQNRIRVILAKDVAKINVQVTRAVGGGVVASQDLYPPEPDADGVTELDMPWLAGWGSFTNGNYILTIRATNPRADATSGAKTTTAAFSVNIQPAPVGAGTIKGNALYFGNIPANGRRIVEAFADPGFSQKPVARAIVAADSSYTLMGLRAGSYFVRGFVDANNNGILDSGEAWGFVKGIPRKSKAVESPYSTEYSIGSVLVQSQGAIEVLPLIAFDSLAYPKSNADSDGDGLTNAEEYALGTSIALTDSDFDGLGDFAEVRTHGTNPTNPDTDGDGMTDGYEVFFGFNPLNAADAALDRDSDGLTNLEEFNLGTDPTNPDTDGDGMLDGYENIHGLNPLDSSDANEDWDGDGLTNLEESIAGSDPNIFDEPNSNRTAQTTIRRLTLGTGGGIGILSEGQVSVSVVYDASNLVNAPVNLIFEWSPRIVNPIWETIGGAQITTPGIYTNEVAAPKGMGFIRLRTGERD